MKCIIPEISWHNRDPVLSLDFQPKSSNKDENFIRLATAGSDNFIVIWYLKSTDNGSVSVEFASDLTHHNRAVNIVRWSLSGENLASGDDESNIILWKKKTEIDPPQLDTESEGNKETWLVLKVLRGHMNDVYDLCWSPDSTQLISGSVDNSAIHWDIVKGNKQLLNADHKGFVQGVAWDPLNQFWATLSSDRVCRIFDVKSRRVVARSSKSKLPVPEGSPLFDKVIRLYHDDTLKSYFRRLNFSPDGQLLIVPSGCIEAENLNKPIHTTYIYTRFSFKQPVIALPSVENFTVAVKCCPLIFELRDDGPKPIISLPYRMVIAVATQSSVVLYDTQQTNPFAVISNIHYTRLTDITWTSDGSHLAVSSTDGYCSIVTFSKDELGKVYDKPIEKEFLNTPKKTFKASKKNTPKKIETPRASVLLEDSVARDSWNISEKMDTTETEIESDKPAEKYESKPFDGVQIIKDSDDDIQIIEDSNDDIQIIEDSTDFKLILEDTTQHEIATKSSSLKESTAGSSTLNEKSEFPTNMENNQNVEKDIVEENKNIESKTPNAVKAPRRIQLITLSSPKSKKKIL